MSHGGPLRDTGRCSAKAASDSAAKAGRAEIRSSGFGCRLVFLASRGLE
jgi:hypothetical protein